MKISRFYNSSLTRSEMKSIRGGDEVYCECHVEGLGAIWGACSGSTVEECNDYKCSDGNAPTGCVS